MYNIDKQPACFQDDTKQILRQYVYPLKKIFLSFLKQITEEYLLCFSICLLLIVCGPNKFYIFIRDGTLRCLC